MAKTPNFTAFLNQTFCGDTTYTGAQKRHAQLQVFPIQSRQKGFSLKFDPLNSDIVSANCTVRKT